MSTKIVRIPVPQDLWDTVRATAATHLQALLDYGRACTLYSADPTDSEETIFGRGQALIGITNRVRIAREAVQAAITALAKAETAHVMGTVNNSG